MSWINRLQSTIQLTSPEGEIFDPKWVGNERSREKKLGLFTYPDVVGTISQDLNVNSTKYPLTVYFDGTDHDTIAEDFFQVSKQSGLWGVIHPVKGSLTLQLVSISESVQPISSGNVTVFNLDFMEPASTTIIKSLAELQNEIKFAIKNQRAKALQQLADAITGATGRASNAIKNVTNKISNAINSVLGPLAQIEDSINSAFNSITRGIDNTVNKVVLFPSVLGGQLQNLVQLPGKIIMSSTEKLATYGKLINETSGISGDTKEAFAVKDLVLGACIGAVADIAANTDAQTRAEIIDQIQAVSNSFDGIVNQLDNDQSLVVTDKIEDQYISQEGSYPQNLLLSALAVNFLLQSSFDLSIEKSFILKEYRLPIMITIAEYGTDQLLDLFYQTNKLDKDEFILLPPGKRVVVYPGLAA